MTNARRDGLILLLLGSVVFFLLGVALESGSPTPSADFRALYYPARALLRNADPYQTSEVQQIYQADSAQFQGDTWKNREIATRNVYPPSAFTVMLPFAMLTWGPAHMLWLIFTVASLIWVSYLMWGLGARDAPALAGLLTAALLVNSALLVVSSNAAGVVVSLCVVAVYCFLRDRFVWAGILCLAISLTIKPQETGLVWLYFLLAGGVYRRRALQTLLVTAAIGLPAVLWIWRISPHWLGEWQANLAVFSAHGGINDPGPASTGGHGLAMVISLQSAISLLRDDPRFYNPATYLICAPLLLVWAYITFRTRMTQRRAWLALAFIAVLTMLPVYHRQYDAKLLLLTVPACIMLWMERGFIGWLAVVLNAAGLVVTGDVTWALFLGLINRLPQPTTTSAYETITGMQMVPAPVLLLLTAVFYLWAYAREGSIAVSETGLPDPIRGFSAVDAGS